MDNKPNYKPKDTNRIPTTSANLEDQIIELLFDPTKDETALAVWKDNHWEITKQFKVSEDRILVPYSAQNNLIQNGVILLPSQPQEYGTEEELQKEIQSFIHKYVDVSPLFEKIASYYVLFSWVYDSFNELPSHIPLMRDRVWGI